MFRSKCFSSSLHCDPAFHNSAHQLHRQQYINPNESLQAVVVSSSSQTFNLSNNPKSCDSQSVVPYSVKHLLLQAIHFSTWPSSQTCVRLVPETPEPLMAHASSQLSIPHPLFLTPYSFEQIYPKRSKAWRTPDQWHHGCQVFHGLFGPNASRTTRLRSHFVYSAMRASHQAEAYSS